MNFKFLIAVLMARGIASALSNDDNCSANKPFHLGPGTEHHEISTDGGYIWPYQVFKSSPLNPSQWQINTTDNAPLAPGNLFITPSDITSIKTVKMPAPQISTDKGQLVWAGPAANATNFRRQMLNGEPVLTYWSSESSSGLNTGHGLGNITFLDSSYNVKTVLCPKLGLNTLGVEADCEADFHESYITDRDTILISAYNATQADLTSVNGTANGWIFDAQFYEINPLTGEILFRWSASEHVPVNHSHLPLDGSGDSIDPYDYFHINSVVNIGDHYLVNSRHCWTVYLLDKTGKIVWRFAGDTGGDFGPLPSDGHFSWEHFVRPHNVTNTTLEISIFNNNNANVFGTVVLPTDLLVYQLPWKPESASSSSQAVLKSVVNTTPEISSGSQGSYRAHLSNGNALADYGQVPTIKEFSPSGQEIWSGAVAPANLGQIYRAYKTEGWHGRPTCKPSLVVERNSTSTVYGYVSWNGATDVDGWNVYAGQGREAMKLLGKVGFMGFETRFEVPCWADRVQVAAVEDCEEVRRSELVEVG